mgnify:FL=1
MNWNEIYIKNKRLDDIFFEKFKNDEKMFEKNCIELIVEIAEFANESRCFKYWANKSMKKEETLEELADCIMVCLYFYNYLNIDEVKIKTYDFSSDILICLNDVFKLSTLLIDNVNEKIVIKIFSYLIYIGSLVNLEEKEIYEACLRKIEKQEKRLEEGY